MQKSFLKSFLLTAVSALALLLSPAVFGQGVVSSGITGTIQDDTGKPVVGAAVTVVHVPTNSASSALTGPNGRFRVSGLRVGGPFTVTATADGYTIRGQTEVGTTLGEETDVTLLARSDVLVLEKFVTTGGQTDLDANASGAGSSLNSRRILSQPTSTRSFTDLIKTNPFVTVRNFPQVQALGMNNRYNSITLDGARLNDQFGLSNSGLFSLKNPFSLDAIDQFSVSLTPYDVSQSGFAGAAINAVSKSGTNEFHGSAYYMFTSSKWQGKDVSGASIGKRPTKFYERTWGGTLGGPIIKDKLFFFVNYEKFDNPSGAPSNPGFNPDSVTFLPAIQSQIDALPGSPDLGEFGGAGANLDTETKRLAKLDWSINRDHRLTVRYSDTEGSRPSFSSFNPGTAFSNNIIVPGLSNTGYNNGITSLSSSYFDLVVTEEVYATQLFSNWTPDLKTQFSFSKNDSVSQRNTRSIFPEIRILNVPGTSNAATPVPISTQNVFSFGTEVSSMGNSLEVNGQSYSGHAEYAWRDFSFKTGFDYEESDFENAFRAGSYGIFAYNYSPTLNIATDRPAIFGRGVAVADTPGSEISKLEQTGYFAQAKWEPNSRFNLTFGLRYDELGSPISPAFNPAFTAAFAPLLPGVRNDETLEGSSRLAPRLGFNYALDKDRLAQIRGGLGVFLGRNPWVWISNSYGVNGFSRFTVSQSGTNAPTLTEYLNGSFANTDPVYEFDPANPLGTTRLAGGPADVNFIAKDLSLPTNLRGNLAIDRKLPGISATLSVEYIYNEQIEAMFLDNVNLVEAGRGADGRRYFRRSVATSAGAFFADVPVGSTVGSSSVTTPTGTVISIGGTTGRAVTSNTYSTLFSRALRLRNVDAGESHYIAFSLDRPFKDGWAYNVTYTRGKATEAQPAGSSTAGSNWGFNIVFNQGDTEVTRSDYEVRDRVQASVSKEFTYFGRLKSIVTLYYEGRTGQPFSYVYSGDLNLDGNNANDTLAVPTGASDPRFDFSGMTTAQRDAYFAFLDRSGLSQYASGYAPRNAFTNPWQNRLDLQFTQEIRTVGQVKVELFANFMNFGSWLDKDIFNYVETFFANPTNSNQNRVLGNASYTSAGLIRPTVALNSDGSIAFPNNSNVVANNNDSRWRVFGGVRLKF